MNILKKNNLFSAIDKILIKLRFFNQTLGLKRSEIYNQSQLIIFEKDSIIYDRNSKCDYIYIIIKGNISLVKYTEGIK